MPDRGAVITPQSSLTAFRRRVALWLLERLIGEAARVYLSVEPGSYISHALIGEAFTARMCGDNPELSEDAVKAYRWAEAQFGRIARGEVGERDLIG